MADLITETRQIKQMAALAEIPAGADFPMQGDEGPAGRFAVNLLLARASHIGTQAKSTIVGLEDDLTARPTVTALALASGSTLVGWNAAGSGAFTRYIRDKLRERVSVLDYGATGDAQQRTTGVATATDATFTDAGAAFVAGDVGKTIIIRGAGAAGADLTTTIASINSATSIELADAASTTIASNASYVYGTDDTDAINLGLGATYSTLKVLHFPGGGYLYDGDGNLGNGNIAEGEGRYATTIWSRLASPTNGWLFRAFGYGAGVRNMCFKAAVTQTGGCYVSLPGPESFLEHFHMDGDFNGVLMTGNVARIRHGRFQDAAVGAIRIRAEGGDNSQAIDDVLMGAQTPANIAAAGIRVRNSSALMITNTSVIQMGIALLIDPTDASENVFSLYASNCFFDNCTRAMSVTPTGTGGVYRCRFTNCWFSSSTLDGIALDGNEIKGIHFESCHGVLNGGAALTTGAGCGDIHVAGGEWCQNAFGMYFNTAFDGLIVMGATIGVGAGLTGNTNNGIVLADAAFDNLVITGNVMLGNGAVAINSAATGNNIVIFNNPGSSIARVNGGLDISGSQGGQIKFPAVQNPSSDPNTLDDYKEGTWTPALTFATPGDLSVAYTSATGAYTKIGRMVVVRFQLVTSSFTHTTASGNLRITGLPFASVAGFPSIGALSWGGITKASYTDIACSVDQASSQISFLASGSGQGPANIIATDTPTGGALTLRGTITYFV